MKRFSFFILLAWLSADAWAQRSPDYSNIFESPFNRYVTFNIAARYGVAMPLGGQKTYIDAVSPANLALEGEWLFPQRFSLGIKTGYQYSQQRLGRQVVSFSEGNLGQDISAVQTRTLTIIPAMASLSYYFAENAAALRPYVQMAGGAAHVNYSNFFGSLVDQQTGFRGAIAPAVGVKYYGKREQGFGAEVQAQYQHVFFNYDRLPNSAPSLMLSAGIVYRFY
ncbi:hypothetical protein [Spirosoma montaniterrae]|uniref:Outer membrane protein beta-barrel domain-containing protein n=1 Tax=Spirosoma montaniterrae TaxID=1178516 RepID=A0A1P9WR94_9BACT|nr:hypothetical protein [Spirosoma montaniterrae]AQG77895.1 hypothetical protein AWR27_00110 [Spirosoma montaniterrae]